MGIFEASNFLKVDENTVILSINNHILKGEIKLKLEKQNILINGSQIKDNDYFEDVYLKITGSGISPAIAASIKTIIEQNWENICKILNRDYYPFVFTFPSKHKYKQPVIKFTDSDLFQFD